jgi:uncharacterized LabA/DUF88 family protein
MTQKFPPIALGTERVAVFVDGQNFHHALKKYNLIRIDYEKMARALAVEYGKLVRKLLVSGVHIEGGYVFQRPFTDALRYQGWEVVETHLKEGFGKREEKEADAALVWEMAEDTLSDRWDVLLLLSGDGDFAYPVRKATARGKWVVVVQFEDFISKRLERASSYVRPLDSSFLEQFSLRRAA